MDTPHYAELTEDESSATRASLSASIERMEAVAIAEGRDPSKDEVIAAFRSALGKLLHEGRLH